MLFLIFKAKWHEWPMRVLWKERHEVDMPRNVVVLSAGGHESITDVKYLIQGTGAGEIRR